MVRGLKEEDSHILTELQLYHNFVRPHLGLNGETPAEAAGIEIEGDNQWLTMIQAAAKTKKIRRLNVPCFPEDSMYL